jgi:hypothetical protein
MCTAIHVKLYKYPFTCYTLYTMPGIYQNVRDKDRSIDHITNEVIVEPNNKMWRGRRVGNEIVIGPII